MKQLSYDQCLFRSNMRFHVNSAIKHGLERSRYISDVGIHVHFEYFENRHLRRKITKNDL